MRCLIKRLIQPNIARIDSNWQSKNIMKKIITLACIMLSPNLTIAQPINDGTFIGVKAGASRFSTPNKNLPNATNASKQRNAFAWGFNLGYNYFTSHYAYSSIELGFDDYGHAEYKGTVSGLSQQPRVYQYDLDMLFGLGLMADSGMSVEGKLGIARVTQRVKSPGNTNAFLGTDERKTRYRPKIELDAGFAINNSLVALLSYSHLFGQSSKGFPLNMANAISNNTLTFGIEYTIPQ